MHPNPCHHPAPQQRQTQIEAGRNHVEQQALDIVLTGVGEDLQEDVHIRVHGPDEILVHPHGRYQSTLQNLTVKMAMAPTTIIEIE